MSDPGEATTETVLEREQREGRERADAIRHHTAQHGPKVPGAGPPPMLLKAMRERLQINVEGSVFRQWVYKAPAGLEPLLVLSPTFWCPVADMLLTRDKIRVLDDFGTWEGELVVQTVDVMRVDVERIYLLSFGVRAGPRGGSQIKNTMGAEVRWTGLHDKWAAMAGDNTLRSGFDTSGAAWQWLNSHLRVVEKPT